MQTNYKVSYTNKGDSFEEVFVIPNSIQLENEYEFFKSQICQSVQNASDNNSYIFNDDIYNEKSEDCDVIITNVEIV